jgi:hypothetical protein
VAVPAAAYLLWMLTSGESQVDYAEMAHVPGYLLELAGAGVTGISGLPSVAGPYLTIVLAALVAIHLRSLGRGSQLAWEALAMAISFWLVTAVARIQYHDPTATRYILPSAIFLLLLAVGLAPPKPPPRRLAWAVLVLAALCLPSNLADFGYGSDAFSPRQR